MIKKPNEMNFADKNIVMILTGMPGVGKTTLALSAPDVLLIDTDDGMCRVNPEHRKDSSIIKTYEELLSDVAAAEGHYKTIAIDTGGALIDLMKDWAVRTDPKASKANGGISIQGFGVVKTEFLRFFADLRKKFNVVLIFHETKTKDGEDTFFDIMCEGSAKSLVWMPADLGAHVFILNSKRCMGFTPTENYNAKSAYGIRGIVEVPELKDGEPNTFLTRIFEQIRANLKAESEGAAKDGEKYAEAIKRGKEIIELVKAPEDVPNALTAIEAVEHALTSKKEITDMLKKKMAELNIVYDKASKSYKVKE